MNDVPFKTRAYRAKEEGADQTGPLHNAPPGARNDLLLSAWLNRDIPERDYLLGDVLCTTSRWLIFGETGVGKTLFAMDMFGAIAKGEGFLNWEGRGAARRAMYLDGELPAETFKERMQLIASRYGSDLTLYGYNRDVLPDGEMPPLNTPEGAAWLMREISIVKPDAIAFDSIMCLLAGAMSEEESLGASQTPHAADFEQAHRASLASPHRSRRDQRLRNQDPRMGNGHRRFAIERRRRGGNPSWVCESATQNAGNSRAVCASNHTPDRERMDGRVCNAI